MKEYHYVELPAQAFPETPYDLSDELFIVPICSLSDRLEFQFDVEGTTRCAIALCKEGNDRSVAIGFDLLRDFVVFHCFVCGDSRCYEAFEKTRLKSEIKSCESREDFIRSLARGEVHAYAFTGDFDRITPFCADTERTLSYRMAFQKFIETKSRNDDLYNCIRLYVFSCNYRSTNKIYQNDSLSLALLYTILDALLGQPKRCPKMSYCDECGRDVPHDRESLAEYQRNSIRALLENKKFGSGSVDLYVEFVTQINKIRSATYHNASYFNYAEEWVRQTRIEEEQHGGNQQSREEWSFDRIIGALKKDPPDYRAREKARYALRDFVKVLLLNRLVESEFLPRIPKFIHVTGKTYLKNDKSKPH